MLWTGHEKQIEVYSTFSTLVHSNELYTVDTRYKVNVTQKKVYF